MRANHKLNANWNGHSLHLGSSKCSLKAQLLKVFIKSIGAMRSQLFEVFQIFKVFLKNPAQLFEVFLKSRRAVRSGAVRSLQTGPTTICNCNFSNLFFGLYFLLIGIATKSADFSEPQETSILNPSNSTGLENKQTQALSLTNQNPQLLFDFRV
jgi:hypothetical protein